MIDDYVLAGGRKLRMGITTGTCAALASQGAVSMLLSGRPISEAFLMTPRGIRVTAELLNISMEPHAVSCAVRKDAGDDKDATDGMLIYARASLGRCSADEECAGAGKAEQSVGKAEQSADKAAQSVGKAEQFADKAAQSAGESEQSADNSKQSAGTDHIGDDNYPTRTGDVSEDLTDGGFIPENSMDEADQIHIDGGIGIGRVTLPGLDQPVGAAAINSVPRRMIRRAARGAAEALGYKGPLYITIYAPAGEEIAKKTFNPRLGIEGGISILGTSGIVEPMSLSALMDSIALEIRQKAALGYRRLILTPGNYGLAFLSGWAADNGLDLTALPVVVCSNFIGDALDEAGAAGFRDVLLVGHIGKLVKVAGGIMNTHSRTADCRMEIITAHAAICGADAGICRELMKAATTDACIEILKKNGLFEAVAEKLVERVGLHLHNRVQNTYRVGAVLFSNKYGLIGETADVHMILSEWTADLVHA